MCVRLAGDEASEGLAWESVPLEMLYAAEPWRTFRWYMGQKHYSGSYWSSTQSDHVIYESRLELARLLYADFDRDVTAIVAQPFLLRAEVDGVLRRHIPDYLMATTAGPLVVDVKPRHRAAKPEHAFTFAWTREAVESRGWRYEVWSEPPDAELANVRFLAGYRRDWLFEPDLTEEISDLAVGKRHRLSGCSTRSSSTKYATGLRTGIRWERRSTACPVVRLRWCGPGSCACSGSSSGRST
ncbi:TnsA-like heteromeric transposase endonuclease subunit [Streptomyces sp. WG7]|uniref:TnsA-like heteromeric transposase endonuclease subunit n=1 Tax=Streptomyces sp. WG7 TaxID=3417650 RepID=UPI003CF88334